MTTFYSKLTFLNQDTSNTETASTDSGSKQVSACTLDFSLPSGWALKERQKFGKKGEGKRISKYVIPYLEAYFLAGDVDKSEKYTAQEMYNELKELVEEGILEAEEIPKVSTIGNWITRYAQELHKPIVKYKLSKL